jgi:hypothetical protein
MQNVFNQHQNEANTGLRATSEFNTEVLEQLGLPDAEKQKVLADLNSERQLSALNEIFHTVFSKGD